MRLLSDKRQTARTPIFWPLHITDKAQQSLKARVVNASPRGLLVRSPQRLPMGEPLEMQIQIGPGCSIRCSGHILREELSPSKEYNFGETYEHVCYAVELDRFEDNGQATFHQVLTEVLKQTP
ncbi:MAG TPA: PilZ domain-containing protein [Chthonomonadaceae bacterium]|nr:PilZ domain-containing protein [Chthonomonadaceae bacterium]